MKRLVVLLLLLAGLPLYAQREKQQYMQESGALSALYRGKIPVQYHYLYNGTYFWKDKEFQKGSVKYNGKLYEEAYLNIDANRQDLQVRFSSDLSPVTLYPELVSWFTMGGKLFVNMNQLGYAEAPDGYFCVLRDGKKPVLQQVRKRLNSAPGNHNGSEIGYYDPNYNTTLNSFFAIQDTYYTLENGRLTKIRKKTAEKMLEQEGAEEPFLKEKADIWQGISTEADVPAEQIVLEGIGLPDDYFLAQKKQEEKQEDVSNVTVSYRNKVYVIGSGEVQKQVKLEGKVTSLETGEPLYGVVVFDSNTATYARTDAKGRYSIVLPGGENIINFSAEAKEDMALKLELRSNGQLNIELPDKVELLKASMVSAQSMANHRTATMGVETVNIRTMSKIPSAFGEGDILKAVLTLPGVKTVGEASGGFNVRGGSQDQNLVLFNGNTIYNPSHLFGIFSAFNPDIVENVELYKSSIPAQFGGRISSVLTVKSKDGDPERIKGSLGIGLLTSRAHVEGPIGEKTTFVAGGRTTYSNWIMGLLPKKNSSYSGGKAGFTDVNASLTHRFSKNDMLQLSGYFADDNFNFSGDTTFHYRNINAALLYRHKGSNGGQFQLNAGYDHYSNRLGVHNWAAGAYDLDTYIRDAFLRASATHVLGKHSLSYGLDAVGYALDPGIMAPYGSESTVVSRSLKREFAVEPALYVSDNWKLSEVFSLEGGIRLSSFYFLEPSKFYVGPEYRISLRYSPLPNLSFKGGFNTMRQYIHLISNTSSISPMDTWKLSDADIAPTTGWQGAGGIYWTHLGSGIDFSVEAYWKQMQNCLDYKAGATLSMNENLAQELVPVRGRSWGVEAMVKKTTGKLTGWASYTYSRAQYKEMQDRGYETIAGGNWYCAPYDKPHEVKVVANWAITHRYSLSMNLDYSTGRPVTVPVGKYQMGGSYHLAYSDRNAYRIPDYFRMDLAVNIDPGHYKKALFHTTFTLGVYNVTGRKNPYSVFFRSNSAGEVKGYMLSVFATQIPYVNINFLF